MNYEQKLKNYLHLNKFKNNFKSAERTVDEKEIFSNDNNEEEKETLGVECGKAEKMIKNLNKNRFELNSVNISTKGTEKISESDLIFDESLKVELKNYKRLIEDCLNYDQQHLKNVSKKFYKISLKHCRHIILKTFYHLTMRFIRNILENVKKRHIII